METTRAKVLLIEDDLLHVQIIEDMVLGDHGLFELVCVDRPPDAIARLEREKIDLVLLDLTLPESTGLETFNQIYTRFPSIPIVVLTASADDAVATAALQAGAQDFLIKWELNSHLLVRAMRYAIERKRNEWALRESEARYRDLIENSGLFIGSVGRDITQRNRAEAELRESEERLRLAMTAAQMGTWEWNLATDKMIGDEYVQRLLDMNDGGLDAFLTRVHSDDRPLVVESARTIVEKGEIHNIQFRVREISGREHWVELSASLRQDNLGQPVRAIGVLQDITNLKKSDESYRLLSSAVQNAEDAILITTSRTDPPGPEIVFANPAFVRMTGYPVEEVLGRTPRMLEGPNTDLALAAQQYEALARGESFSGETVNYRKDGTEYTVAWHVSPVRDANGEVTHFISVQRNVSLRRRTEERLTQQATLLDSAQDAIILRDLNDGVIYWNHGAQRLYGWTSDEVKGRKLAELLHREPPPELMKAKHALFSQGQWGGELRQITKDGRDVIVQARWTLLRDAVGRPKSVLLINTDITEQKRLESMVLRAQRLESIGALASGIAHDLNNVLAPILMALHTLQQRFTDESSQRWLSLIHKSAERGRDLIGQVLSFARGAEGERVPLGINHLIKDISKILQETLPKNIELQIIVPDGVWMVIGDTTQIHQVLMNLCINARDAMPDGGRLVIKTRNRFLVEEEERLVTNPQQKQYVRITVADTGVGIPPEIIDRVFDPFFTTKEKGQGTGLGLSTVQGIVRGHGGFVNVISQVGKGTEFKIYLPAQDLSVSEEIEEAQQSLPMGHDELIMVVDDEADIREVTSRTLESNGYRVVLAKDGREAVEIYRRRGKEIDIVLTDMVMPNLDGPGTIRALKQLNPQIVVVATSGVRTTGKLAEATQEGARSFLPKPYTADKLLAVIAEALADGSRNGR
ncbi:MAG: hybrid sensor histidine kinase/response regulator [Blastocatellia bacterium]